MKKRIFGIIVGSMFLSGCSLPGVTAPPLAGQNGTINKEKNVFATQAIPGSLWRTDDGGKNFLVKSQIDEKTSITKSDILSIAYHPQESQTLYVSSVDSGIFKTEDGGDRWTNIPFPPKRIYSFILDKNDPNNRMFASGIVNDWGKIFRTDDGGATWKDVYTEPGQKTPITALSQHFRDRNVIFAGTAAGTVVKSIDSGETWKNVGNKINGLVGEITFDSEKSNVVYLLTFSDKLYYSPDGGMKWINWEEEKGKESSTVKQKISNLNARGPMPSGIISIMSDPIKSGVIYAGTNKGIFRSTTFGKYWDELNIIESAKKFPIRSIAVNPKNSNEIVFVAGKAFYKSIDGGETWMTTGLNVDRGASFVAYNPSYPEYLFIGLRNFK